MNIEEEHIPDVLRDTLKHYATKEGSTEYPLLFACLKLEKEEGTYEEMQQLRQEVLDLKSRLGELEIGLYKGETFVPVETVTLREKSEDPTDIFLKREVGVPAGIISPQDMIAVCLDDVIGVCDQKIEEYEMGPYTSS